MKVDNPQAFRFIMQDEIYLLEKDKGIKHTSSVKDHTVTEPALPTENLTTSVAPALTQPIVETPGMSFNYMGGNNKRFLILVNYTTEQFIAAAHLTALESILKRKDLAIADVAIVNTHSYPAISITQLNGYFKPRKLLVLGAKALPADTAKLSLNEVAPAGGYSALYSFSFDEMMESNDNKKAFWEQMKKL